MTEHKMKSIWYFVGLILMSMGIIIILSGVYNLLYPPAEQPVLAYTHPDLWWGGIMTLFGGVMYYTARKEK